MKYFIFYDKETLEIKGYSTDSKSMEFPFVSSDVEPFLLWNWKIENGVAKPIRTSFTDEEWDIIMKEGKL